MIAKREKGAALLAALILIMALVLTLGTIFYRHQIDVSRLTRMMHGDQALLMGLSVESWTTQLLSSAQDNRQVDSLDENWSIAVPVLPVDGGFIRGCIDDLQATINLNSFSSYDTPAWFNEMISDGNGLVRTWMNLFNLKSLDIDESMAVSIIDWVDVDTVAFNEMGAEQITYDAARSPVQIANGPFTEVTELSVVRGYDLGTVQALEGFISTLPRPTTININTAPEALLIAMGGSYSQSFASYVLDSRPFYNVGDFQQSISEYLGLPHSEAIELWPEDFIGIASDYFQLNLQVTLGEATIEIHSIMDRHNRNTAVVISRSVSVIPAIVPNTASYTDEDSLTLGFCENLNDGRS